MILDLVLTGIGVTGIAAFGWLRWVYRYPYRVCHWCKGNCCAVCRHTGQMLRPGARLVQRWTNGGGRRGT